MGRNIPIEVEDYIAKSGAYFNDMIPRGRRKKIKRLLKNKADMLLEKYDGIGDKCWDDFDDIKNFYLE